jgi:hypothetical protein
VILVKTKRTHPRLLKVMAKHYSQPRGFVGRSICYAIIHDGEYYGHIVGGSATKFLPGRNEYFGKRFGLNVVVNNIFFHCVKSAKGYPYRNFTTDVVKRWRDHIREDWRVKYGDAVIGYESLVELPRTGELYKRDGWKVVGQTKGFTCKRTGGKGTDSWSGKRVWDTENLRPKLVLVRKV